MARAIDGDALKQWCEKIIDQACHPATVQIGEVFLDKVRSMPTLTPPNEPLTLDELREMDGEPVWCKELKSWALIYTEDGKWEPHLILPDLSPVINFPVKTHNRTYTLYRRPPGGDT